MRIPGRLHAAGRSLWLFEVVTQVFSSVAQLCLTLCDPMNRSTPGLPVHHKLPEFTQTHAHRVGDAIQPSHPMSSPSPPAPNPSQHHTVIKLDPSGHLRLDQSKHTSVLELEFQRWNRTFCIQVTLSSSKSLSSELVPLAGHHVASSYNGPRQVLSTACTGCSWICKLPRALGAHLEGERPDFQKTSGTTTQYWQIPGLWNLGQA